MSDVTKKEAAAISAAIATHLSRQNSDRNKADFDAEEVLDHLLQRVAKLEARVSELSATLTEESFSRKKK